MKIAEMKVGQTISERLVLAGAEVRKTKGNPPADFLSMIITDGTDTLDGKIWQYNAKNGVPEINKVYIFQGNIGEFAGKKQITIINMQVDANQNMLDFSCVYDDKAEIIWQQLEARIESIYNTNLRKFVSYCYNDLKNAILESSSAKAVHHVGIGGNACHTIEVCDIAVDCAHIMSSLGREISIDLVRAGALLHDIGKPFVYKINGPVVDVTLNGHLHDHIVMGCLYLSDVTKELGYDYVSIADLLIHIVASHHGQLEYGSPVTPKFAEAYIVNFADGVSASMDTLFAANDKAAREGKEMTDKLFTLSNREHILQTKVLEMLGGNNARV